MYIVIGMDQIHVYILAVFAAAEIAFNVPRLSVSRFQN